MKVWNSVSWKFLLFAVKKNGLPLISTSVGIDTISREWRCKWSADDGKKSLVEAQKALESILPDVKSVDGVEGVQRVVCGGCLDFKVVTTLPADKFGAWEEKGFEPESKFIEKLKSIDGLSIVETQTYTVSFSLPGTLDACASFSDNLVAFVLYV